MIATKSLPAGALIRKLETSGAIESQHQQLIVAMNVARAIAFHLTTKKFTFHDKLIYGEIRSSLSGRLQLFTVACVGRLSMTFLMISSKPLPTGALIRKLERLGPLGTGATDALASLPYTLKDIGPHEVVLREGDQPANIYLLINGCVFRSTVIDGGGRQIMALHVAGAMLNLQNLFLERMDHTISALVPTTVALIPRSGIRKLFDMHPLVAMRLWHQTFIETAIARKWLTGVGRRTAYASIAHFLSEFVARSKAAGMSDGKTCEFPLTQAELGDALGLSVVHVNRTLKKLSRDGLISWNGRSLTINNWAHLNEVADFDPAYLEL